jgi:16S rRNA (cytosine967-C5)-methyltransferase
MEKEGRDMTAREAALITLSACEKQGAWSDGFLKKTLKEAGLDRRDAALATRLCRTFRL